MHGQKYRANIQAALIALCVSLLVAVPMSDAASRQVKIVVKKVVGPRGPQGPPGLSNLSRVRGKAVVLTPSATGAATVDCPSGTQAISTGYDSGDFSSIMVTSMGVSQVATHAYVYAVNKSSSIASFAATATCATVN